VVSTAWSPLLLLCLSLPQPAPPGASATPPTAEWLDRFLCSTLADGGDPGEVAAEWSLAETTKWRCLLGPVARLYAGERAWKTEFHCAEGMVDEARALELDAAGAHRQVHVVYRSGLELWCNLSLGTDWTIEPTPDTGPVVLPPTGWYAHRTGLLEAGSVRYEGNRVDFLIGSDVLYIDTRGKRMAFGPFTTKGALAAERYRPPLPVIRSGGVTLQGVYLTRDSRWWLIPAPEADPIELNISLADQSQTRMTVAEAFGPEDSELGAARVTRTAGGFRIEPVPGAVRYRVKAGAPSSGVKVEIGDEGRLVLGERVVVRVSVPAGEPTAPPEVRAVVRLTACGLSLSTDVVPFFSTRHRRGAREVAATLAPGLKPGDLVEVRATLEGREDDPCVATVEVVAPPTEE
jgi:hypothetical protein